MFEIAVVICQLDLSVALITRAEVSFELNSAS